MFVAKINVNFSVLIVSLIVAKYIQLYVYWHFSNMILFKKKKRKDFIKEILYKN